MLERQSAYDRRTKRPEDRNAIQTLKKDLATRVARKGGQWSDRGPTRRCAPEDVEKQPATEFRVLQDNADRFQHKGTGGRGRFPSTDARGEELWRRAAAAGRGLHDRRSPRAGRPC